MELYHVLNENGVKLEEYGHMNIDQISRTFFRPEIISEGWVKTLTFFPLKPRKQYIKNRPGRKIKET